MSLAEFKPMRLAIIRLLVDALTSRRSSHLNYSFTRYYLLKCEFKHLRWIQFVEYCRAEYVLNVYSLSQVGWFSIHVPLSHVKTRLPVVSSYPVSHVNVTFSPLLNVPWFGACVESVTVGVVQDAAKILLSWTFMS